MVKSTSSANNELYRVKSVLSNGGDEAEHDSIGRVEISSTFVAVYSIICQISFRQFKSWNFMSYFVFSDVMMTKKY